MNVLVRLADDFRKKIALHLKYYVCDDQIWFAINQLFIRSKFNSGRHFTLVWLEIPFTVNFKELFDVRVDDQ